MKNKIMMCVISAFLVFVAFTMYSAEALNITTCEELFDIELNMSADYQLMNDIDCTGFNTTVMGKSTGTRFNGSLDGNMYAIRGMEIKDDGSNGLGMFHTISGANIHHIYFINNTIEPNPGTPRNNVGILFYGAFSTYGINQLHHLYFINNTINTTHKNIGTVGATMVASALNLTNIIVRNENGYFIQSRYGNGRLGGIVYTLAKNENITNVTFDSPIYVTTEIIESPKNVGGICSFCGEGSIIEQVKVECTQTELICGIGIMPNGSKPAGALEGVGAICGHSCDRLILRNSYATVNVTGDVKIGSIAGSFINGTIENVYGTGKVTCDIDCGGICGGTTTPLVDIGVFYDNQTTGYNTSQCGEGRNTADMKTASTFINANWSFSIWNIRDGFYPVFGVTIILINTTIGITVNEPQNITYSTTNISLIVEVNKTVDTWTIILNGNATILTPNTTFIALEGSNTIFIQANDTDGNQDNDTVVFTVTLIPPSPPITGSFISCVNSETLLIQTVNNETINGVGNLTITQRFLNCERGCLNETLTNWGGPGCVEESMLLWVILLVGTILMALLFKGIQK